MTESSGPDGAEADRVKVDRGSKRVGGCCDLEEVITMDGWC